MNKSKATTVRTATKRKAAPKTTTTRRPLKDRTNVQSDGEDMMMEEEEQEKPRAKRPKTTATRKPPRAKAVETLGVIPETQPDPDMIEGDVEQSIEMDVSHFDVGSAPAASRLAPPRARSASVQPPPLQPRASARSLSAQPTYPAPRERSGSVSGTERERRGGDPELRRKLNEMTKKYENVNLKYQNLQEIGRNNAETNFEKLKRVSDDKAKDAEKLIASLKKEIAELRKSTKSSNGETDALQKQITALTTANTTITKERDSLKEKLHTSQNEVKSLEAKLIAARQQVSQIQETAKAADAKALTRSINGSASEAAKEAKMKENLYSDLTGMIIRGVKRKEGEDEFDCIQTGRNGTLHFHLSVANDASVANPKTPTGLSYEEAEFSFEPFLDESRDREMFEILPDYLTEEICFPRDHAVKFYTKLLESMTRKVVVEED
ncbi:Chromosome segregation protein Csm1/Pcs1 [Teratosphaeria destructans]|uniref:Chromosome segregation protein Csm1/Pcs1 n=1 Tax=Teratosphaeria destructans TaxID=418781 RepID=A0A9W7VYD8_9PEZI|nr:Chromosome segregation protein Csm1/Pcs1 [Teratosphaeria destructans]